MRGDHDGLTGFAGLARDLLLQAGDALNGHFDAEITAGNHEAVTGRDDGVEVVDGRRLLDLDDDGGAVADDASGFEHVFMALHERERNPIGADGERAIEIGVIFFGQCADGEKRVGQADPLAGGERAAGDDLSCDAALGGALHAHPDLAVVEEQDVAGCDGFENLRMG